MSNYEDTRSCIADGAITQYTLVSTTSAGKVSTTGGASEDNCYGIAQQTVADGEPVNVQFMGESWVQAGAAINHFANKPLLQAAANGQVVPHSGAGNYSVCQAVPNINQPSANAQGELIRVKFTGPQNKL
tara:strand:+ start:9178 stop:9567 length:390 start_codon:yes stop_codon:yes gene_type:complete